MQLIRFKQTVAS